MSIVLLIYFIYLKVVLLLLVVMTLIRCILILVRLFLLRVLAMSIEVIMSKSSKVSMSTPLVSPLLTFDASCRSSMPVDEPISSYLDSNGNVVQTFSSGRKKVSLDFSHDPGLTEQSHAQSCDIQNIISQHIRMNVPVAMPESAFVDLTQNLDYQGMLNKVLQIESLFEGLPLDARVFYDHDPAKFMAAVEDPSQRDQLIKLGIFNPDSQKENLIKPPEEASVSST